MNFSKRSLATYLAIVKGSLDGEIMHVCICDSGHLGLLDGRDAALWMKDEDGDVGFVP